ncbi:iron uptake transporter deferrochelatase/peroxidase subunit [Paenibacillus nasutitermitis]|uniref:Deferrochelatase n=1 Tax=Paenibacillus nasutitermitis TaxID=1652958 RepID=A0A917DYN4_9BACL|nr:iron uptake transporter deferrochelatase/peroxidase subunit [Paenibacillus nasutitermitis]GGD79291.1 deferrochelatase [Paenibacillus nasutitermitis]
MESKQGISRKDFLKLSAAAGMGIAIGASGVGAVLEINNSTATSKSTSAVKEDDMIPLYGIHQPGIITPQQTYMYLAAFRITTKSKSDLIVMLKNWTKFCNLSAAGGTMKLSDNSLLPPADTGETLDLLPSNLTLTFGLGRSFFVDDEHDRFGIAQMAPRYLNDIPRMPRDNIDPAISGGDICVQVCADDQQVAFHAVRNLIRLSTGQASLKWMQEGFASGTPGKTPRNLFGFKDGTANELHLSSAGYDQVVWAGDDEPDWMRGGSYLAYRKIQMKIESWDRTSLADQEATFGRSKVSGAAFGAHGEFDSVDLSQQPANSHVALAKQTKQQIHRRAYSYTDKVDPRTGNVDAGLLFISYQRNPDQQLLPMLRLMQNKDALNSYVSHVGSGMFACPAGLKEGRYFGQTILEA